MVKKEAVVFAATMTRESCDGVRYVAAKQNWREGDHWYVKGSNKTGTFKGGRPA